MNVGNIRLEVASLWVQIWGAPFDMVSPQVAKEVGSHLGEVEEVEWRKKHDDFNMFMRVRVALPISKPIRRGGFIAGSNHLPILLHVQSFSQPKLNRGRSFKFEESWLLYTDCEEIIQGAWGKAGEERTGLAAIQEKIKVCGVELLAWGSPITDSDTIAIKEIQKHLDRLNEAELTEEAKAEFLVLSKKMDDLLQKQEIY